MNMVARWFTAIALAGCLAAPACAQLASRVVSLGGTVTEIVYDLGQGERLVADDLSSLYPEAATKLPRVGYYRAVPLEGVLSMKPDLVLASEHAGPPKVLDRIRALGVKVSIVSDKPSLASLYKRVEQIAAQLGVPEKGRALLDKIRTSIEAAQSMPGTSRRVLLVMNRTGQLLAAGGNTAANEILTLAGLKNVLADQKGYKPVSAESVAALAPDMIVITTASMQASNGKAAFLARPGIAMTPAAKQHRVVAMDDLLILGLGPRTGQAIRALKQAASAHAPALEGGGSGNAEQ
jgi:iron complex transport system substrate-binding protein